MRFVTIAVYIVIGVLLAWFAAINWLPVTLKLWGDYELTIRLPALLLLTFLLGALPLALLHSFSRWRWRRRVARLEQALEENAASAPAAVSGSAENVPAQ
jgi:putative membrane protein